MAVGRRKRIKDRVKNFGVNSLAEHERLELLLYNCILYKDTNPLARKIYDLDKNLTATFAKSKEEFLAIEGVSDFVADYLTFLPKLNEYINGKTEKIDYFSNIDAVTNFLLKEINLQNGLYLILLKENCTLEFILLIGEDLDNVNKLLALATKTMQCKYCLVLKTLELKDDYIDKTIELVNYFNESLFRFLDIFIVSQNGVISFKENNLLELN